MGFVRRQLKDVCKIESGFAFKSKDLQKVGVPLIRIGDVADPISVNDNTARLPETFLDEYKRFIVTKGDILIALTGTPGKYGVYHHEQMALLNQRVGKISVTDSELDKQFLYYYLAVLKQEIFNKASGVAQLNVSPASILELEILLPTVSVQKQIAIVLSKARELIEKRKQQIEMLDEFLQSVFLDMFGDPVSNPRNWDVTTIEQLTEVGTGATPRRNRPDYYINGTIPWIKTAEIEGKAIYEAQEYITKQAVRETNCKVFPIDTILIAMYGQGRTRGRTGIMKIAGATNQACAALLPSPNINTVFLFTQLNFRYEELRSMGRGGNQPNLNLSMVKTFMVIKPPRTLQNRFDEIVKEVDNQRSMMIKSLHRMENAFNSIMQRAFKGESFS